MLVVVLVVVVVVVVLVAPAPATPALQGWNRRGRSYLRVVGKERVVVDGGCWEMGGGWWVMVAGSGWWVVMGARWRRVVGGERWVVGGG